VTTDDRQLLLATHRGHEASARVLWDRHGPRLLAHARLILRDRAAADDVVQAVMCRLLELPKARLAAVTDVAAFLSASVRHQAINYLRAARREAARRSCSRIRADASSTSAVPHHTDELAAALAALPRRQHEVIILKNAGGLTFDQIASVLETNRNTVAARYRSALESLRKILDAPTHPAMPGFDRSRHASKQGVAHE